MVGPTAIGKTALAIEIAKQYKSEILSCDSRQIYREMCIGTAVPSASELEAIPHHFIQNKSIQNTYTVGDYEREALQLLDALFKKNNIQVMVGGSGLYVNAVLNGLDDFPAIDPEIRNSLNHDLDKKGLDHLKQLLKELDPEHYEKVALDNPQRVIRALEVSIGTGLPYSSFLNKKQHTRNFIPIVIGLEAEREKMYERINHRVDIMMENGLLNEVQSLLPYQHLNALQTVGYRELFAYLTGETSLEFAIEEIKKNTRRFAKRQLTWFKRDPNTIWITNTTEPDTLFSLLDQKIL